MERKHFLEQIADDLSNTGKTDFSDYTIVFANKRAGTYFLSYLSSVCGRSIWAPRVLGFEDFLKQVSGKTIGDRVNLILRLYEVYNTVYGKREGIERFVFWGEMLIKDFDEIDRNLVDPSHIFSLLKQTREIESIDFLSNEEKRLLQEFWSSVDFEKKDSHWLQFWERLGLLYAKYREQLIKEQVGYSGLWMRELAENPHNYNWGAKGHKFLFAGFNALAMAEEKILEFMVESYDASIYWDYDNFYLDGIHEAGKFMSRYKSNTIFKKDFIDESLNNIGSNNQNISLVRTSSWTSQVKYLNEKLSELSKTSHWRPERTVIVLPDEKLLLPVLGALPGEVRSFNVTMGFSLLNTTAWVLFESIVNLYSTADRTGEELNFEISAILEVFRVPLIAASHPHLEMIYRKEALEQKIYRWTLSEIINLGEGNRFIDCLFNKGVGEISDVMEGVFELEDWEGLSQWDMVFIRRMHEILIQLHGTLKVFNLNLDNDAYKRMVKQICSLKKVPFSGEPVSGLQIMGMMETRNLDFEHVFILSANEDYLPGGGVSQSFIPDSLRRAFRMPGRRDNQAIQSYLFYRLFHKSESVTLFYNTDPENGGEPSRYIWQLLYEFPVKPMRIDLDILPGASSEKQISIQNPALSAILLESLKNREDGYLSPSAIFTYLECSLRFYFKYILSLKIKEEPENLLDARLYGIILHTVMEELYRINGTDTFRKKGELKKEQIEIIIESVMDRVLGKRNRKKGKWTGKFLISREMIGKITHRIYELDSLDESYEVIDTERTFKREKKLPNGDSVLFGGNIDRIEESESFLRVIDFKTGKEEIKAASIQKAVEEHRKGIFQILFYAWLLEANIQIDKRILPVIIKTSEIFSSDFTIQPIEVGGMIGLHETGLRSEFEKIIEKVIEELFVLGKFEQTKDQDTCKYCDYASICRR